MMGYLNFAMSVYIGLFHVLTLLTVIVFYPFKFLFHNFCSDICLHYFWNAILFLYKSSKIFFMFRIKKFQDKLWCIIFGSQNKYKMAINIYIYIFCKKSTSGFSYSIYATKKPALATFCYCKQYDLTIDDDMH